MGIGKSSSKAKAPAATSTVGGFAPNTFQLQMFGDNPAFTPRDVPIGFDAPGLLAQIPPGFVPGSAVLPKSPAQLDKEKKGAEATKPASGRPKTFFEALLELQRSKGAST